MQQEQTQESVPFWYFTIKRLMEFPVSQRVLFYWADGKCTERIIIPDDDISFVSDCIAEHENPSPHSGLQTLQKITVQLPAGVDGWSKPVQIWPDQTSPQN